MASNAPYTVEIPLKSRDRVEACPEVERCQLAVEVKPKSQALAMVDTGMGGMAVQVKLVREGKGCDAEVNVGLVQSGGPIAVGGGTSVWERRYTTCTDLLDNLFVVPPTGLLCARYFDRYHKPVSIITANLADKNWLLVVSREGAAPFRQEYQDHNDNLYVSTALSQDGMHLYALESRSINGVAYIVTYSWYTYHSGDWSLYHSGQLYAPNMLPISRPGIVDRDGHARCVWAIEQTGRTESYQEDGDCLAPQVIPGETYQKTYLDTTKVWGGYWDITNSCEWVHGSQRVHGHVYGGGDLTPEFETITSPYSLPSDIESYRWSGQPAPGAVQATGEREQNVERANRLTYSTQYSGQQTKDYGEEWHFHGASTHEAALQPETGYIVTVHSEQCSFSHSDGSAVIAVTPGGWVIHADAHMSYRPTAPMAYTETVETATWDGTWNRCPSMLYRVTLGMEPVSYSTTAVVYPKSLGDASGVDRSFTSIDIESGDVFYGAMAKVGGDSVWHVYKNGVDITAAVTECIGRPMDDFYAIYWRA